MKNDEKSRRFCNVEMYLFWQNWLMIGDTAAVPRGALLLNV
jgi:hypothetical protein